MMEGEIPGSCDQITSQCYSHIASGRPPSERSLHNISVQTGEEFSMEFLQDRVTPNRPAFDPVYTTRMGYNAHPNSEPSYEDPTVIPGMRRVDSDCSSDLSTVSNASFARGHVMKNNSKEHLDRMGRIPSKNDTRVSENSTEEYYVSCYQRHHQGSGTLDSSNPSKLKFICSFGGKILPRPGDGKLRYVGGEKRIISITSKLSLRELMQKTLSICNHPHTIKYQLPGEDLDALISVCSDEDLQNMIEEYYGLEKADGSQRIRIFLISLNESEGSSVDAKGLQSNSEYQYVVAVNNVPDQNLMNNSSVNSLSSQIGHHLDGSPSHHIDSSLPQADTIDVIGGQNHAGMLMHQPPSHLPFNSQIASKLTNQSPFIANPVPQKERKNSQKQSCEDHFVANHSLENYYVAETGYFMPTAAPKPHPNTGGDVEMPVSSGGMQFQNHQYIREVPQFIPNDRELDQNFYYEKPILQDRGFHSEMIERPQEDLLIWVSGSNNSLHPPQGIPHAYSDSLLQEQGEKGVSIETSTSDLGITTSRFLQNPCQSNLQGRTTPPAQNIDFSNPSNLPYELHSEQNKISQFSPAVSDFSHHLESYGRSEPLFHLPHYASKDHQCGDAIDGLDSGLQDSHVQHGLVGDILHWVDEKEAVLPQDKNVYTNDINATPQTADKWLYTNHHAIGICGAHVSSQELEALESTIATSLFTAPNSCSGTSKERSVGRQLDGITTEIHSKGHRTGSSRYNDSYEPVRDGPVQEEGDLMAFSPSISRAKDSSDVEGVTTFGQKKAKEIYVVENSSDLFYTSFQNGDKGFYVVENSSEHISYLPPGIMSQNLKHGKEHGTISSTKSDPLGMMFDTGLTPNLDAVNPPLCSLFPNPEKGEGLRREISLLDQDIFTYPRSNIRQTGENLEPVSNGHNHIPMKTEVTIEDVTETELTVEDVTGSVPSGIPACPPIIPHVVDEPEDDEQTGGPKLAGAESNTPDSGCEVNSCSSAVIFLSFMKQVYYSVLV